jgi:hypothetical protein
MSPSLRRILRMASLAAGGLGTLFWLGGLVAAFTVPAARADGFHMLGAILVTFYWVTLVLPALVLALLDRWPIVSALFGAIAMAVATDVFVPWLPWGLLS